MTVAAGPAVVVIGSGRFAQHVCWGLAMAAIPLSVHVIARSRQKAEDTVAPARAVATVGGHGTRFAAEDGDGGVATALERVLRATGASVVVTCASQHSPWEIRAEPTSWTDLLGAAGFGFTLPLQTPVAVEVSRVCAGRDDPPAVLNAAYPDAVNPVLAALDLPVTAGVGNVAALEPYLRRAVGVADPARVRMLGHHLHLKAPDDPADEVRVWIDDAPLADVRDALRQARSVSRIEVNTASALLCARLVRCLLTGEPYVGHLPGPRGLPGGYPVTVAGGRPALRLPDAAAESSAVTWNRRISAVEGVCVGAGGRIEFSPRVVDAVRPHWPGFPAALPVAGIGELTGELLRLRAVHRGRPAAAAVRA
jgi:hypothetical protein